MGSDFIDRTKLEALAEERFPFDSAEEFGAHWAARANERIQEKRNDFLAGAAAYAALLDAETFTERKHEWRSENGVTRLVAVERRTVSTPWLPSEGGEKP